MDFHVEYSSEAVIQLERLDKAVVKRIFKKIEASHTNPHLHFKRLTGRPEYKLRIGDYRAIVNIDDSKKLILIMSIGHRKNVYEKY